MDSSNQNEGFSPQIDSEKMARIAQEAIEKNRSEQSKIGIVVVGGTGQGKSTLLNAMFGTKLADTGIGTPMTKEAKWWPEEGYSSYENLNFRILDTKGIEEKNYKETMDGIISAVEDANSSENPEKHAHIAWLVIKQGSARVQESHKQVVDELRKRDVPVVTVITSAIYANDELEEYITKILDVNGVVSVNSIDTPIRGGQVIPQIGLDQLADTTGELVAEAQEKAFYRSIKVNLEKKKEQAKKSVDIAAATAAGGAATHTPHFDAIDIVPIQAKMISSISSDYGLPLEEGSLDSILSAVATCTAATAAGRLTFGAILKVFPGIGTVIGGTLNATIAFYFTRQLGHLYIDALHGLCERNSGEPPTTRQVIDEFRGVWKERGQDISIE